MIQVEYVESSSIKPKAGVIIKGNTPRFDDIIEFLKALGFKYHTSWKGYSHIWEKDAHYSRKDIERLYDFGEVELSPEYEDFASAPLQTKRIGIPFDETLLRSDPKGDFQLKGIKRGISQNRLLYAFEMGLGKTYTVISVLNHLWLFELIDKVLIVAPSESIYNFRRELVRFSTFVKSYEDVYIANVNNRDPFSSDARVVIMTYRTFLMLSDDAYEKKHKKKFKASKNCKMYLKETLPLNKWGTSRAIILDESHKIKNTQARQTKALHLHKENFEYRYLLTGTPAPNGVAEFYSQMDFLDRGLLGQKYKEFIRTVAIVGNHFSENQIVEYLPDKVAEFLPTIDRWYIRELSKDNLDLPDLIVDNIYVEMTEAQQTIYRELVKGVFTLLKEEKGVITTREVRNTFPFLLQALKDPCLLKGKVEKYSSPLLHALVERWKFEDHPKLEICSSLLESYIKEEKKKTIIWSGHPKSIESLSQHFSSYKPFTIHGEMKLPKGKLMDEYKTEIVEEFKNHPKRHLLIVSYLMVNTAVNITEAPRSIYWDRDWDLTTWLQTVKRTHRIGQEEPVHIRPLVLEHSLEELQDTALNKKDLLNMNFHKYDTLTAQQWEQIFEGRDI